MEKYQETFESWNKLASLYHEKFMNLTLYDDTYDFFCQSIPKANAQILEIGCGPGNITRYLLSARPDFNIVGIDIAPNMIALARKNNPTASFAIMDCRKIDTINEKQDGIVCGFCLPYLSPTDMEKLILDCYRLLNENGVLYVSFVEGDPHKSGFVVASSGDRCYFYFHELDELKAQLSKNGFDAPTVCRVAYKRSDTESETHTIVLAKKKATV